MWRTLFYSFTTGRVSAYMFPTCWFTTAWSGIKRPTRATGMYSRPWSLRLLTCGHHISILRHCLERLGRDISDITDSKQDPDTCTGVGNAPCLISANVADTSTTRLTGTGTGSWSLSGSGHALTCQIGVLLTVKYSVEQDNWSVSKLLSQNAGQAPTWHVQTMSGTVLMMHLEDVWKMYLDTSTRFIQGVWNMSEQAYHSLC